MNKINHLIFSVLLCICVLSHSQNATNPLIYADVPDIAILRVGSTYYMSSTTMHMNPGVPIMKSTDLVNWDLVNYCYQSFDNTDSYNLNNGKNDYGHGSWASSIRYFKGNYYVSTFANTGKTYIYKTANIETGPWTVTTLPASYHDCSLFFDDDDRVYLVYGNGDIRIIELNADATAVKSGGVNKLLISDPASAAGTGGLRAEGSQVHKINGYYYVSNICWPSGGMRTQLVSRSTSIAGTYETRVSLKDQGIAQGGFVDTPDGKWYCYLFRDFGSVGRIPYLVPMTWSNNWPVLTSPVPTTLSIPKGRGGMGNLVSSDEFSAAPPLKLAWQWNHNPKSAYWSMSTAKTGYLRLTNERTDPNVLMTTNTLTQRTFGPKSCAYTAIDLTGMKDGDYAGMVALQKQYGYVGVKMVGTTKSIVMVTGDDVTGTPSEKATVPLNQNVVYVRVDCDFTNRTDKATFYYSLNGTSWTAIGTTLQMSYTIPQFIGYRFGLFTYATGSAGGYADFDFFRIGANITEATNSVKINPTITLTSPANKATYVTPASITISATASDADGTISKVDFYNGTTLLNSDASSPYSYSWTNVAAGTYYIKAIATDNQGNTSVSEIDTIKVNVAQAPYGGTAWVIPGIIQAENYDVGGNGFAYSDSTSGNSGGASFRTDEDVDLETCTDAGGGYNLGWATKSEWLEYTVKVNNTATYDLDLRVACNGTGRTLSVSMDGVNIASNVTIPNTGGWQTWQTVTVSGIPLTAGQKVMRITVGNTDYVNLNYVEYKVVTDVEELEVQTKRIYPNPFTNNFTIELEENSSYQLTNANGLVLTTGSNAGTHLLGNELPKGIYFIRVTSNSKTLTYKLVKE
ncbi:MAG: family 43 glycosylhydrolase [Cytophagales bacterium]